jgi:hypothetical protein
MPQVAHVAVPAALPVEDERHQEREGGHCPQEPPLQLQACCLGNPFLCSTSEMGRIHEGKVAHNEEMDDLEEVTIFFRKKARKSNGQGKRKQREMSDEERKKKSQRKKAKKKKNNNCEP